MWYENKENLISLAEWLDDQMLFNSTKEVIYFFEKPWSYSKQWRKYQMDRIFMVDNSTEAI